jgi:hypothetical protein
MEQTNKLLALTRHATHALDCVRRTQVALLVERNAIKADPAVQALIDKVGTAA